MLMKRIFSITATIAAACCFSSCETTGDPTQGGLFGWSETKSNQRLAEKEYHLRGIEADTARRRARNAELSRQVEWERRNAR